MGISAGLKRASLAVLLSLVFVTVLIKPADAAHSSQATPVRLHAALTCVSGDVVNLTFTIQNIGHRTLTIDSDMHLYFAKVTRGGPQLATILFMWPAPDFKVVPPGQSRTFMTGPVLIEEPGTQVGPSARRLLLEAEVRFVGRDKPVRRIFSFPGCNG